jgi:apolipoprotein D and lipocalin family protein
MKSTLAALLLAASSIVAHADTPPQAPLEPIDSLDLGRYKGTWYEIAKFSDWTERHCAADTSTELSGSDPLNLSIVIRCVDDDGGPIEKTGVLRQLGNRDSAILEKSYAPTWLSLVPASWSDYWVIDIDAGYTLAAVSEAGRGHLWILSRTRKIDPQTYARLLQRLQKQGFDTDKLVATQQD